MNNSFAASSSDKQRHVKEPKEIERWRLSLVVTRSNKSIEERRVFVYRCPSSLSIHQSVMQAIELRPLALICQDLAPHNSLDDDLDSMFPDKHRFILFASRSDQGEEQRVLRTSRQRRSSEE